MKCFPLSANERAASGFTHRVTVTWEDLTETTVATAQTIAILAVTAGQVVSRVAYNLETPFEDLSDAAFNTNGITIGDGNDVDRFLSLTEINRNGTEVNSASGPGVIQIVPIPVSLAAITAAGDVLTNYTPGFRGKIEDLTFVVTEPATTADKLASLNAEIGTTNVTGGVVALTTATCTPLGVKVAGSAITGANIFGPTDTISIEAASVTAFSEGRGVLLLKLRNLDAESPGFTYTADDTVDLVINAMAAKALDDIDAGKLHIFLKVSNLPTL